MQRRCWSRVDGKFEMNNNTCKNCLLESAYALNWRVLMLQRVLPPGTPASVNHRNLGRASLWSTSSLLSLLALFNLKLLWILVLGFWCFPIPVPAQTNTNVQPPKVSAKAPDPRRVDVNEFEKLWQDKHNVVLDVRTPREFAAGHIPGAINLDVNAPEFGEKISTLSKDKVYLVHCAAGVRSARACQKMTSLGFQHLIDLAPGFKGWQQAGKPVEK